jgi:hypothetical protein
METYEPDSSASDRHLVASIEGDRIIGQFTLCVVIDIFTRAIVCCGIDDRPVCASSMPESPPPLMSEAVMTDPAVLE